MQQLNEFLKHVNYLPAFNAGIAALGLTACVVVVILMLHTLHVLGTKTPLYKNRKPVEGWNKRFYPVGGLMVIFLLIMMWLLNVWSHKMSATQ
jgi:hypothetical protein